MKPRLLLFIIFIFFLIIFVSLLLLPQASFSRFSQSLVYNLTLDRFRPPTPLQVERMKQDPLFCVQNQNCTTLCGQIYEPQALAANTYFIDANTEYTLYHACSQEYADYIVFFDHVACVKNTCTPSSLFLNPIKLRNYFTFIGRKTRPEVQLPYSSP